MFMSNIFGFGASALSVGKNLLISLLGDTISGASTASASIQLRPNGNIVYTGSDSSGTGNWYDPTTAGIGDSYYVAFNYSGTVWDGSTIVPGTVYSLSTARTVTWSQSTVGMKNASLDIRFYSDAAGTQLTGETLGITVQVEKV